MIISVLLSLQLSTFCKSEEEYSNLCQDLKQETIEMQKKPSETQRRKPENREKKHETSQQREAKYLRFYQKGEISQQIEQSKPVEGGKPNESRTSIVSDWTTQVHDKVSRMASFLWEKKSALGIGMMLTFAGRLGVEAHRPLGRSNTTDLSPIEWKGFNNLSHPTAFEPRVHWRKLQAVPDPNTILRCLKVDSSQMKATTVPVPLGSATRVDGKLLVLNSCPNDARNARAAVGYVVRCVGDPTSTQPKFKNYPLDPTTIPQSDVSTYGPGQLALADCDIKTEEGEIVGKRPPDSLSATINAAADTTTVSGQKAIALAYQEKTIKLI